MTGAISFPSLIEAIYKLSFDERLEVKNLLAHNIAASRRSELLGSYKEAKAELASGNLEFTSDIHRLKKML